MASARAALGKARRGIIKRKKTTDVVTGALSTIGTVAAFGASQAKKAETAWDEYEAGMEAKGGTTGKVQAQEERMARKMGGRGIKGFTTRAFQTLIPGGDKGWFQGPEGDVRIGNTMYDRSKIQEAGSFLGSDAAAVLSDDARSQYLQRTSPGTALPDRSFAIGGTGGVKLGQTGGTGVRTGFGEGTGGRFSQVTPKTVGTSGGIGVSAGFGDGTGTDLGRSFVKGYEDDFKAVGSSITDADRAETFRIQTQQQDPSYYQDIRRDISSSRHAMPGPNVNIDFKSNIKKGLKDLFTNGFTGEGGGTGVKTGESQIPEDRYSYKPLSSKNDAKFGRYGDDAMKMIDGQPAHIDSSIEGDMSPEDIKKYGAGTINPITGKKEYFLGAIATGLAIGSSLYKGYQATQNQGDVEAGKTAAGDIYQEQVQSAGQQKTAGLEQIKSQYTTGMEELTLGTQMQVADIDTSGTAAISKSNLVSGSVESQMEEKKKNLMAMHATTAKKQMDTKKAAEAQELFAFQNKERSAQDLLQGTLTGLESQPTTFLEGVFS